MTDVFETLEALNPDPENRGNPGPELGGSQNRTWVVGVLTVAAGLLALVALGLGLRDRPDDDAVVMVDAQTLELQQGSQPDAPPGATLIPQPQGATLPTFDLGGRDDPDFVAGWLATELGTDMPESLQFPALSIQINRYAALVNHAHNVLRRPCIIAAGFEMPDINVLANVGPERMRSSDDFELEPFADDGGYGITGNRARVDSTIGAEANVLSAAHAAYLNALQAAEMARYEQVSSACLQQVSVEIMAGSAPVADFYALVNVGSYLSFAATDLLDEHPQAQNAAAAWRRCMGDAGYDFDGRDQAQEQAFRERLPRSGANNPSPGPIERAIAGADRTCSEQLNYVGERSAGIAAAEQYMVANDATTIEVLSDWQKMQPALRSSLEAILGVDFVADYLQG